MCKNKKEQLQCATCSEKDDCPIYSVLEDTLDKQNQYAIVNLNCSFLISHDNIKAFLKEIHTPAAIELAKQTSDLNSEIIDILDNFGTETFSLGSNLDFKGISNEEAFHNIAEYIKDIHGANSNG